jgi:hypothetical protein
MVCLAEIYSQDMQSVMQTEGKVSKENGTDMNLKLMG